MPASTTYDRENLGSNVAEIQDVERGSTLISPEISPVYSSLNKVRANATLHYWNLDDYEDPRSTPVPEGSDVDSFEDAFRNQAQVFNYTHTLERTAQITDDMILTDTYTVQDMAKAKMKKIKELNRDTEKTILGAQARSAGSKGGAARQTAGLAEMLSSGSSVFADATEYEIPAAQSVSGAPTEAAVSDIIKSIFDECGEIESLRVYADSGWQSQFVDNTVRLSGTPTNQKLQVDIDGTSGYVPLKVQQFETNQGIITLFNTNSKCSTDTTNLDTAYFLNPEYAHLAEFGGSLIQKDLEDKGGGPRCLLRRKICPVVTNPRAHGFWSGI